jgi:negative regulator of replication initiation
MRTITVSEDIYEHLRLHAELGEDATSVLRRLLKIGGSQPNRSTITGIEAPTTASLRPEVEALLSAPSVLLLGEPSVDFSAC